MSSANVDLVRSIYARWERGDFSSAEWADPEIEIVTADGPEPSRGTGLSALARFMRVWLSGWEDFHSAAEACRELDDERVFVLAAYRARDNRPRATLFVELQHWMPPMDDWNLKRLAWRPHHPEILSSTDEGRAIVLDLPEGEVLQDHQVHEGTWIIVIDGEVRVTDHTGQAIDAQPGILVKFAPRERHEVSALVDSRLLLLLAPWPGAGHPGTLTLEQKADQRDRAAERAG